MKLLKKVHVGSKLRRVYDGPKTPFERVLASKQGDAAQLTETVAMKITGHKTASVFRRYAIVAPSQIQDAMKAVELNDGTLLAKS